MISTTQAVSTRGEEKRDEQPQAQSPALSESSMSSINSNSSTGKLIQSLSTDKLSNVAKPDELVSQAPSQAQQNTTPAVLSSQESSQPAVLPKSQALSENQALSGTQALSSQPTLVSPTLVSPTLVSPTLSAQPEPKIASPKRRPIKFTVRKVSHEPIKSPVSDTQLRDTRRSTSGSSHHHHHRQEQHSEAPDTAKERVIKQLNQYQQKYDQYESRNVKINKEVDFLTNLLPPFNVEIDYATRTKITRAIEKLRMKQDEIEKKKYSLGITISRLWRDLDGDDMWVRTVSN